MTRANGLAPQCHRNYNLITCSFCEPNGRKQGYQHCKQEQPKQLENPIIFTVKIFISFKVCSAGMK